MYQLAKEKRRIILHLLVEGNSMRSISRVTGASRCAVNKLLLDAGRTCKKYHNRKVRKIRAERVQCDEIWSYLYAKDKNLSKCKAAPPEAGTKWTWTAIDSDSKLIISYTVGDRSADTATEFMDDLESRLATRVQLTTDGHNAYPEAVDYAFGGEVDFAQLVKSFEKDQAEIKIRVVEGKVADEEISTSFVERQNLTMRMCMRRYTRKCNGFSKSLKHHNSMVHLYFLHYNFIRVHETLGTTPAKAAGITKKVKDLDWLIDKIDKNAPKPNRPKTYKTRKKRGVKRR